MPGRQELPQSGPTYDRALVLARQAVTESILGGPGLAPAIEAILSEASSDRVLGATVSYLLIAFSSQLAQVAAATELAEQGLDEEPAAVASGAAALVDDLAAAFAGRPT